MCMSIQLLDTTLREGLQDAHLPWFSVDKQVEIAKKLDETGLDFIEVGQPTAHPELYRGAKEIIKLGLKSNIVVHGMARKMDVDAAHELGAQWIGIYAPIDKDSLLYQYSQPLSKEAAMAMILESVRYAKQKGLNVRFSIEKGANLPITEWIEAARQLENVGVDRLSYVDTLGILDPKTLYENLKEIKKAGIGVPLHVHLHNDKGFALENAMTAYENGIKCIDTTIGGLGERRGIPALDLIIENLIKRRVKNAWKIEHLNELKTLVESCYTRETREGEIAHVAGPHLRREILHLESGSPRKEPTPYYPHTKESTEKLVFLVSRIAGKDTARYLLKILGVEEDEETTLKIYSEIRDGQYSGVSIDEFSPDIIEIKKQITDLYPNAFLTEFIREQDKEVKREITGEGKIL